MQAQRHQLVPKDRCQTKGPTSRPLDLRPSTFDLRSRNETFDSGRVSIRPPRFGDMEANELSEEDDSGPASPHVMRSECPAPESVEQSVILVGVDGSEASIKALRWAADQASLINARLRIVTTWYFHVGYSFPPMLPISYEEPARHALKMTLASLGRSPAVPFSAELIQGHPRQVLVELSAEADLLVVGSRGLGEFVGMLLGSVSEHCAREAKCTVVIVR